VKLHTKLHPDLQELQEDLTVLYDYQDWVESMMLTRGETRMLENTLGLVGEAGEIAEKIKKYLRDNFIKEEELQKELGDVLFYWIALHNYFDLDPAETVIQNILKLENRKLNNTLKGSGDDR